MKGIGSIVPLISISILDVQVRGISKKNILEVEIEYNKKLYSKKWVNDIIIFKIPLSPESSRGKLFKFRILKNKKRIKGEFEFDIDPYESRNFTYGYFSRKLKKSKMFGGDKRVIFRFRLLNYGNYPESEFPSFSLFSPEYQFHPLVLIIMSYLDFSFLIHTMRLVSKNMRNLIERKLSISLLQISSVINFEHRETPVNLECSFTLTSKSEDVIHFWEKLNSGIYRIKNLIISPEILIFQSPFLNNTSYKLPSAFKDLKILRILDSSVSLGISISQIVELLNLFPNLYEFSTKFGNFENERLTKFSSPNYSLDKFNDFSDSVEHKKLEILLIEIYPRVGKIKKNEMVEISLFRFEVLEKCPNLVCLELPIMKNEFHSPYSEFGSGNHRFNEILEQKYYKKFRNDSNSWNSTASSKKIRCDRRIQLHLEFSDRITSKNNKIFKGREIMIRGVVFKICGYYNFSKSIVLLEITTSHYIIALCKIILRSNKYFHSYSSTKKRSSLSNESLNVYQKLIPYYYSRKKGIGNFKNWENLNSKHIKVFSPTEKHSFYCRLDKEVDSMEILTLYINISEFFHDYNEFKRRVEFFRNDLAVLSKHQENNRLHKLFYSEKKYCGKKDSITISVINNDQHIAVVDTETDEEDYEDEYEGEIDNIFRDCNNTRYRFRVFDNLLNFELRHYYPVSGENESLSGLEKFSIEKSDIVTFSDSEVLKKVSKRSNSLKKQNLKGTFRRHSVFLNRCFYSNFLVPIHFELEVVIGEKDSGEDRKKVEGFVIRYFLLSSQQVFEERGNWGFTDLLIPQEIELEGSNEKIDVVLREFRVVLHIGNSLISQEKWDELGRKYYLDFNNRDICEEEEKELTLEIPGICSSYQVGILEEEYGDIELMKNVEKMKRIKVDQYFVICGIPFSVEFFPCGRSDQKAKSCSLAFYRQFTRKLVFDGEFEVKCKSESGFFTSYCSSVKKNMRSRGRETKIDEICPVDYKRKIWKFNVRLKVKSVFFEDIKELEKQDKQDSL